MMDFGKTKYAVKMSISYLLYYSGILFLLKTVLLRNTAVVLMYHRVLHEHERQESYSNAGMIVDTTTFTKHMEYIKEHFNVVSQQRFLDQFLNKKKFADSTCLITFDDGWLDTYTNAYPVLKKNDLSATIFLPVAYIGTDELFWQEKMSAVLTSLSLDADEKSRKLLAELGLTGSADEGYIADKESIQRFVANLKGAPVEQRETVLSRLLSHVGGSLSQQAAIDTFFTWEQAREMMHHGVEFGSHTVHHYLLTQLQSEVVAEEVHSSKKLLTKKLGVVPPTFCYPNGNHTRGIVDTVAGAGYTAAFSTIRGHVRPGDNPFTLKRIGMHEDMVCKKPLFLARLLGLL